MRDERRSRRRNASDAALLRFLYRYTSLQFLYHLLRALRVLRSRAAPFRRHHERLRLDLGSPRAPPPRVSPPRAPRVPFLNPPPRVPNPAFKPRARVESVDRSIRRTRRRARPARAPSSPRTISILAAPSSSLATSMFTSLAVFVASASFALASDGKNVASLSNNGLCSGREMFGGARVVASSSLRARSASTSNGSFFASSISSLSRARDMTTTRCDARAAVAVDYRTRSQTYNTGALRRFTTACATTVNSLGDNSANARRTASFSSAPPS